LSDRGEPALGKGGLVRSAGTTRACKGGMRFATMLLALVPLAAGCAHSSQSTRAARDGSARASAQQAPPCARDATATTHAERITKQGSVLDLYFRQDGVWLSKAPILVNEDFDFMLATTMEDGVGAGLAAMKRKQSNERRAKELAPLALSDAASARIAELHCCKREVYFVLWGPSMLRVVVDHVGEPGRGVIAEEHVGGEMDVEAITDAAGKLLSGVDCAS
jgi:hypothetical protein